MIQTTALQRRLLVEDYTRLRRPDEIRRFAASQRRGRVDANPHQIDAVAFALERIPEGGCILADEVGLGKTIEAGLVVSQLFAEGMSRVLLIVPKALMGQWQTELRSLFGLEVKIGAPTPDAFTGDGIFIVNREFAGGIKGAPLLSSSEPFDLAIIDEAHELFAGIYKRFDKKSGEYQVDQKQAQTAHRVYNLLTERDTPALLLTATPIQNNLDEIWGLVQFIERNNRLLGDYPTFRHRFSLPSADEDGLPQSLALDLRNRLQTVVQRTLRNQAQPFLDLPFVERHAKTVEYQLTHEERQLYNDITEWLMRPDLLSYTTATRRLLVVGFHRRMASSFAALKSSLANVANRLRKELDDNSGNAWIDTIAQFAADLEEANEEFDTPPEGENSPPEHEQSEQPRDPAQIRQELELLESFIERANALQNDSKAQCLLTTLAVIREQAESNSGTGKAVIFTESIETQTYLTDYLGRNGFTSADITLFRGDNSHSRAQQALANWRNEVALNLPASHVPPPEVAVRLALVHEFKTRSKLLIATEAGAKGLNLQFCESLINYDLPWNPQRIEQRIGRVHRYGQQRGVFVFNLVDRGNEAANLTYDILSRKLDLFGKVLDASDDVLHTPDQAFPESLVSGIGIDFEKQVRQVYQQSSSIDDVIAQLRSLRETIDQQRQEFQQTQERCAEVIESRLDDSVATIFRNHQTQLPACLAEIDRETDTIVESYLNAIGCEYNRTKNTGSTHYVVDSHPHLPDGFQTGAQFVIGETKDNDTGEVLFQDHPLLKSAFQHARKNHRSKECVAFVSDGSDQLADSIGKRGRLRATKLRYNSLVNVERLLVTLLLEDSDDPLEDITVSDLLAITTRETSPFEVEIDDDLMDDCVEETAFDDKHSIGQQEQQVFDARLRQLDQYLQDRAQVVNERILVIRRQLSEVQKKRDAASAPTTLEKLNADAHKLRKELERQQAQLDALHNNDDPSYQSWKNTLMDRRKVHPEQTLLIDANFEVVGL